MKWNWLLQIFYEELVVLKQVKYTWKEHNDYIKFVIETTITRKNVILCLLTLVRFNIYVIRCKNDLEQ